MSFSELDSIKPIYNAASDKIAKAFYAPLIKQATRYDRAVAYFSSASLLCLARELVPFIQQQGTIRLVVSSIVDDNDIDGLKKLFISNEEINRDVVREKLIQELKALANNYGDDGKVAVQFLSQLILSGVLELRFAIRHFGIYHSKIGVFYDADGNKVAFNGSANETKPALLTSANQESINTFCSWKPEIWADYGQPIEDQFKELWEGREEGTNIVQFNQIEDPEFFKELQVWAAQTIAIDALIKRFYKKTFDKNFQDPKHQGLREYQREAVDSWYAARNRGILAMATGTGKTRTALAIVKDIREEDPQALITVVVPYQLLAEKWCDDLEQAGFESIKMFESKTNWMRTFDSYLSPFSRKTCPVLVTVSNTFEQAFTQERLKRYLSRKASNQSLIIFDECHHYNNPVRLECIKDLPFKSVLGLSATPYSQFEQEPEKQHLSDYMGDIVYTYDLTDAINNGFLTPYQYQVHTVELTRDEQEQYIEITANLIRTQSALQASGRDIWSDPAISALCRKRRAIINNAQGKLDCMRTILNSTEPKKYTLFYCGAKSEDNHQIKELSKILDEKSWQVSRVTSEESKDQRERIVDSFKQGMIDALLSIKVLDEGIDIPACETAYFLASDSSNRQWIQRRGRVLRKSFGKQSATIVDFIVVGCSDMERSDCITSLGQSEIARAQEFANDAQNQMSVIAQLEKIRDCYGLNETCDQELFDNQF